MCLSENGEVALIQLYPQTVREYITEKANVLICQGVFSRTLW